MNASTEVLYGRIPNITTTDYEMLSMCLRDPVF
jgi:hypothetical protein